MRNTDIVAGALDFMIGHGLEPVFVHVEDGEATIGVSKSELKRISKGRSVKRKRLNGVTRSFHIEAGPLTIIAKETPPIPDITIEEVTL